MIENMKGDPEYRRLMEKHGYTMAVDNSAGIIQQEVREKINQVKKAIQEIEQKMAQQQHGINQNQLDSVMRSILLGQMDVAEVYSPPTSIFAFGSTARLSSLGLEVLTFS